MGEQCYTYQRGRGDGDDQGGEENAPKSVEDTASAVQVVVFHVPHRLVCSSIHFILPQFVAKLIH